MMSMHCDNLVMHGRNFIRFLFYLGYLSLCSWNVVHVLHNLGMEDCNMILYIYANFEVESF